MLVSLLLVATADLSSRLGRLDYASLPQQALMEMLIEGIENKTQICGANDQMPDISEWDGVRFNGKDEVAKIFWNHRGLKGSLDFQWLPSSIVEFEAMVNELSGTISRNILPQSLQVLHIPCNRFFRGFCLDTLPTNMSTLEISENQFTGEANLTSLPKTLKELYVEFNEFDGTINLSSLPSSLTDLHISHNKFSGELDLTQLPDNIETLDVSRNAFSSTVNLTRLSSKLKRLFIGKNYLFGETDFSHLPESLEELYVNCTRLSGTVYLNADEGEWVEVEDSMVTIIPFDASTAKQDEEGMTWRLR